MDLIQMYDTTLRDGTQAEDIAFLVTDKIRIAEKLDELGIHYIEGGWPGSNPKDIAFFKEIKNIPLKQAKIAAFGATRRAKTTPDKDHNLRTLIQAEPDAVTIFGKTWDFHVREALRIGLEENLELIFDSLKFLKENVGEVIYDAEHFFDGYRANPEYALKTLQAAEEAGADCLVLCDTNGGTLPHQMAPVIQGSGRLSPRPWAFIPTTTAVVPSPMPLSRWRTASSMSRVPSTGSESVAATPISAPSFPACNSKWASTASPTSNWQNSGKFPIIFMRSPT